MFPIDFLRHAASAYPDATAAIDGDRSFSYRTLLERSEALAVAMEDLVGKPRPTVAILGPNNIEMLVALLAIHAGGSVIVPLNGRNVRAELDAQIAFAKPDLIVVHRDHLGKISAPSVPILIADTAAGDPRSIAAHEERVAGRKPRWNARLDEINGIKFTGGSSGRPKGVLQSFRCINTLVASVILAFNLQQRDRFLCAAPMTHGAGAVLLPTLARGGCVVMTADTSPGTLLDLVERHGITTTWMPPTLLYKLIDEQKARPREVRSIAHLIWGGAAASVTRLREAIDLFGPVIEVAYGQTEAPLILSAGRGAELEGPRLGSVGRVGPLADVAILDEDGNPVAAGEMGEICARGDLLMSGYLEMPEETAKTISGGWLHTGDIGMIDADGFLYVKDRIRDVVITGGFNVYPSDVEVVLSSHPAVSEAVVFGIPDAHWGERLEATVELRDEAVTTAEEIIAFCKERVGAVKTPKQIHIVTSLPRSAVGKVLRREARDTALAGVK